MGSLGEWVQLESSGAGVQAEKAEKSLETAVEGMDLTSDMVGCAARGGETSKEIHGDRSGPIPSTVGYAEQEVAEISLCVLMYRMIHKRIPDRLLRLTHHIDFHTV